MAERVQESMEKIRAQLQDGAALKASTASMQGLLDHCDAQIADLVGKRDPDDVATGYAPPPPRTPHQTLCSPRTPTVSHAFLRLTARFTFAVPQVHRFPQAASRRDALAANRSRCSGAADTAARASFSTERA